MKIDIYRITDGEVSKTVVTLGSLSAKLLKVGNVKKLTVDGRGNVRQVKALARKFSEVG